MQGELPVAVVRGEPVTAFPQDLYIPPHALEVFLEAFEGPLDLLLYLIRRQNLDVLDIPVAEITRQYVQYVELMKELRLDLAAEYLVMAAILTEIKSRLLLPRPADTEEEEDPRAELVRRLQEYERFKQAAQELDALPRVGRDIYPACAQVPEVARPRPLPKVTLQELLAAFQEVLSRAEMFTHHRVEREALSVRERMSQVLAGVQTGGFVEFTRLFDAREGRMGVVVTLLAVLELIRESLLELVQAEPFGPIHVKAAGAEERAVVEDGASRSGTTVA
ncbi:MAG TPA: segregation/condensation protein A [Chromatiales bacterium]|nr:segregation/condensation protein A [Chromatiales bacterium]HDO33774.1 segregation/condensation protein A [Chromatiales bacterium]